MVIIFNSTKMKSMELFNVNQIVSLKILNASPNKWYSWMPERKTFWGFGKTIEAGFFKEEWSPIGIQYTPVTPETILNSRDLTIVNQVVCYRPRIEIINTNRDKMHLYFDSYEEAVEFFKNHPQLKTMFWI